MNARLISIAAAVGLLVGSSAIAQAPMAGSHNGGAGTAVDSAGHKMQSKGVRGGPKGSRSATGHRLDRDDVDGFGDSTTGFGGRDSDDRLRYDRDDRMMDSDPRGIDKQ